MWEWLDRVFGRGFMPHGHCYLWTPSMVWSQVTSNFLIGLAYASIASTLGVLVRRIQNIPFAWVYVAFGVFILSCGLTHWFDVVTVWHPIYWADAAVRILTAVASVATAVLILPMVPQAVALAEAARLSDERRLKLEAALADLELANAKLAEREQEAQQRAELSEEQFQSLVETMPQLAWISSPTGKNLYRNGRWAEYTGLHLAELRARGWESVHDPALVEPVAERWRAALKSGTIFDMECRLRHESGEYRWFIARAVPLRDKTGRITRWIGTCTDIHEQRKLRDEAMRTARMKDEFLATVSHELRTPLNAMLGWSRMLRADSLPAAARAKALETVERNAIAQAQLIDDLLDISRIVSGNMRLEMTLVDPAAAVEAAIDSVRPAASAKELHLETALERKAGPVAADPVRLQQIVWNLLINAIKFTPKGGRVSVVVARKDAHVEVTVTDTGIGISADFIPHVFERFSQEDGSIRRVQGGLGLGLAIVKHLVELHGGSIDASSDGEGKGAAFTVKLPVAPLRDESEDVRLATRSTPPPALENPAELVGLRVLLVEDEPDSRELIETVLESCGVHVTAAADAERALSILKSASFDVILSDIGLPGRDGYELMKAVRAEPAFTKIPTAAVTAYARPDDRLRALGVGYQMHVSKPVEPAELVAVVTNLARIAVAMRE